MSVLVLTRRTNEKIRIGDNVILTILEVRGDQVRLGIEAPRSVGVHREEVWVEMQAQNIAAASPSKEQVDNLSSQLAQAMGKTSPSAEPSPSDTATP